MLFVLSFGPNWKGPYFELIFTSHQGLNPVWALHNTLASLTILYVIVLHAIFDPWEIYFRACCKLILGLFWAPLQHWRRAQHCLVSPCVTCSYIPYLAPFLHKLAAPFASVFGPWSELKVALFWPILHVSFTLFFCLVIILYTSCFSTFWASFYITFLACLYTDFEAAIYCKCSYFWSIFSVVEGNFSVWVFLIPLASLPLFWPLFLHAIFPLPMLAVWPCL